MCQQWLGTPSTLGCLCRVGAAGGGVGVLGRTGGRCCCGGALESSSSSGEGAGSGLLCVPAAKRSYPAPKPPAPLSAGGYDNEVKVWDTNSLQVVCHFELAARVHAAAMSACATSHCLVAVGSGDTQVGQGILLVCLVFVLLVAKGRAVAAAAAACMLQGCAGRARRMPHPPSPTLRPRLALACCYAGPAVRHCVRRLHTLAGRAPCRGLGAGLVAFKRMAAGNRRLRWPAAAVGHPAGGAPPHFRPARHARAASRGGAGCGAAAAGGGRGGCRSGA